jgi:hypothetical protein
MNPQSCTPVCSTQPVTVQVPGPAGAPGPQVGTTEIHAAGTAYSLTATPALLTFGTTSPSLVLAQAGTYILFARVRYDTSAGTVTNQTVTTKLHCANNTVADVANTTTTLELPPQTTASYTAGIVTTPPTAYVASAGDNIQLWGSLSGALGAGNLNAVEADIMAIQIAY